MEEVITFFKEMGFYDYNYFNYIKQNTIVVDKPYEEIEGFVAFYPDVFKLILPSIKTYRDILIWIHEYSHALFPDDNDEIFPNIMEAFYVINYIDDKDLVDELVDYTIGEISRTKDPNHISAKRMKLNAITRK